MLLGFLLSLEVSVKHTLKCLAVTSFVAVASFKLRGEKLYYFNKYKDPIE